jgi:hypothetical protein
MSDGIKRPEANPLVSQRGTGLKHTDQTTKQPVIMRCANPDCFEENRPFDFESDEPTCPKCGQGPPAIQKRVLIHFLAKDPRGKITGQHGIRYQITCDPTRKVIATLTNGEAGTGDATQVNCPGCMGSIPFAAEVQKLQRSVLAR